jgi:TolA-binding protein
VTLEDQGRMLVQILELGGSTKKLIEGYKEDTALAALRASHAATKADEACTAANEAKAASDRTLDQVIGARSEVGQVNKKLERVLERQDLILERQDQIFLKLAALETGLQNLNSQLAKRAGAAATSNAAATRNKPRSRAAAVTPKR